MNVTKVYLILKKMVNRGMGNREIFIPEDEFQSFLSVDNILLSEDDKSLKEDLSKENMPKKFVIFASKRSLK